MIWIEQANIPCLFNSGTLISLFPRIWIFLKIRSQCPEFTHFHPNITKNYKKYHILTISCHMIQYLRNSDPKTNHQDKIIWLGPPISNRNKKYTRVDFEFNNEFFSSKWSLLGVIAI